MKQFITGIAMFLLCSLSVYAKETTDFNPNNPPEPSALFALSLDCDSALTGSVTGGGNYHTGDWVSLAAIPNNHYVFVAWMDDDSIVSNESSFNYIMPDRNVHLIAHFERRLMFPLSLEMDPSGIGSVYGSGYYESGKAISISSSSPGGYLFKGWWEGDSLVKNQLSFDYLMPARPVQLTARFDYNPSNPNDPTYEIPYHRVYLIVEPTNGGSLSQSSGVQIREGESLSFNAYQSAGFVFDGWYRSDTLYTTQASWYYTVGTTDDTLTARFHYDPSSPADPIPGNNAVYNLSTMTQTAALGSTLAFPVYLLNENLEVYTAVFEMTFPVGLIVDYSNVSLSSRRNGHALTCDSLGNNIYRFTISNEQSLPLMGSSGSLLTIPVTLPVDWVAGSSHPVLFSNATIGTEGGSVSCPAKNGAIGVKASENQFYASFYADIHLNRVLFTNLSSTNLLTSHWDFGDGQSSSEKSPLHVYSGSGSYEVLLIVSDGLIEDSVRMSIDIANESTWSLKGYYTLSKHTNNVKNFTSGLDMFSTFSRCKLTGDIFIQVESGQTFDIPLDLSVDSIFKRIGTKILYEGGPLLTFTSDEVGAVPLLDFSGSLHKSYIETVLKTAENFRLENVEMAFSGLKLNVTELNALNVINVCSGHATKEVDLSLVGNQYTIDWMLTNTPPHLSGQLNSGTELIPSMSLSNDTTITDTLIYNIRLVSDSYVFFEKKLRFAVRAELHVLPTLLAPASNAGLESPAITFSWKSQNNVLYDLFLWEYGTTEPISPYVSGIWTGSYSDNTYCKYGKAYKWKILARNVCDSIFSAVDSFRIGRLPDLMIESITLSKAEIYAGEGVDVNVRVRNVGGRVLGNYWGDELYLVSGVNNQNKLPVSSTWGWKMLEADSSYKVTFHVVLPLDTVTYTYFMFVADNRQNLAEISDLNNTKLSDSLRIGHYLIDAADFDILSLLYQKTAGANWVRHWDFSTDILIANNWHGVGFQGNHVVSIDLNNNNLNGQLPAKLFNMAHLRTLYLNNNKLSGRLDDLSDSIESNVYQCDSLVRLNLGFNYLSGEISSFANRFPKLDYLNLESNRFSEIDTLLSENIRELYLQNQTFTHPDIPLAKNFALNIPSLFRYRHDTQDLNRKDLSFYLLKNNSNRGWISYNESTFALSLNDDWIYAPTDSVELVQNNSYLTGSRAKLHLSFLMGDVNVDQQADILDIQQTLNRIYLEYVRPFNYYAANTFPDTKITVQDIVATVNMLLASGVVIDTTQKTALRAGSSENFLFISNGELILNTQVPVSAMDLSLKNINDKQLRMLLNSVDFQVVARNTSDGVRFIVFSGSGKEIPAGQISLAQLSSEKAEIVKASLANRQAEPVPVVIAENRTDLPDVKQSDIQAYLNQHSVTLLLNDPLEQVSAMVYTMQGVLIDQQVFDRLSIGSHTIEFSHTLPTGAYLLKLIFKNGNLVLARNYKWIVSK